MSELPTETPPGDPADSDLQGLQNGYHAWPQWTDSTDKFLNDWRPREDLGSMTMAAGPGPSDSATRGRSWPMERWMIARLLHQLGNPLFDVLLWDGSCISGGSASAPTCRLRIHQRATLWKLWMDRAFHFPEEYARGLIDVEGDFLGLLCTINRRWRHHQPGRLAAWKAWLLAGLRRMTLAGNRRNIACHYDLGNDFYRLWLDQQLVYTCAYFPDPGMTLEEAQIAKLDLVCRKLRLKPGETVLEAGCGWGALALHMARRYGVRVRACNISVEQIRYARSLAQAQGLADRVEFVQEDWRNLQGHYDTFVSVGMLEHVGPENFEPLGKVIERCLSPHGRGLIHTIGQNYPLPLNPWIEHRIFPGAEPPALEQIARIFPAGDLTVLDVENLRLHYAETLWHWLNRFEQSIATVRANYGDQFARMWRMYLALSYSAFETGGLQLYQFVFSRADSNRISRTRADWYQSVNPIPLIRTTANQPCSANGSIPGEHG